MFDLQCLRSPNGGACCRTFPVCGHWRQVALGVSVVTVLVLMVTVRWQWQVDYVDTTHSTAHIELNASRADDTLITAESHTSLLPASVISSFPEEFFRCRSGPMLEILNQPSEITRFNRCGRVVYNRVPKCGSRTVLRTIKKLITQLNYTLISRTPPRGRYYFTTLSQLVAFAHNFSMYEEPFIYTQHLHYVNFTQLEVAPPVYINVIRDPVQHVTSHFYYAMYGSNNAPKDSRHNRTLEGFVARRRRGSALSIHKLLPFFCGQTTHCRLSDWAALQQAKQTVSSEYLLLGLTEDLPAFFTGLQSLLPHFFRNATQVYYEIAEEARNLTSTSKKPAVKPETVAILKDLLHLEYDFHSFVKQRFYATLKKIQLLQRPQQLYGYYGDS